MMNRKQKNWLLFSILFFLNLIAVVAILLIRSDEPPLPEITKARKKITEAEYVRSSKYAKELYQAAVAYYDTAMLEWHYQNKRLWPFRNYDHVKENASTSSILAEKAMLKSKEIIAATEELLGFRISLLEGKLHELIDNYGTVPLSSSQQNDLGKSKILLSEGIFAFRNENYQSARMKLDTADLIIMELTELYEERLAEYFTQFPQWARWIDQTISDSKRHKSTCVVVDKFARVCFLYARGKLLHTFKVELGSNWIGDKSQQGDKSTPEGLYMIEEKKSRGETRYHKALLLDYPNEDDKKRFLMNKRNNLIRSDAKIGGYIEIHGNGGTGIDWTDGCIALKDSEMDILFELCKAGDRVTIVGSTKPLEGLFAD